MADLNGGKGKFTGVDGSVNYEVSFKGATKVAEKVKKGGTETKSDGYVVDAIDIDWGGLKLTTIDNGWSQKTVSSTEQNAGKGDNTKGIHSTAYLLNLISSSFTQIYNQIGGSDSAGLRKKINDLETSIGQITGSSPGQLTDIRDRIQKIEQELDNPGAANTLVTILDTLDGFNKDKKGDVKKYIDDHDKVILGTPTDEATAYTVYGVRKYVDTTAKTNLIGKKGDKWSAQQTLYGVVEYVDTTAKDRLIGTSTDTTIDTHYGLKHILIGNTADTTINTHWGVKNSLIGTASDTKDSNTIKGAKKYADEVKTASYNQAKIEASNVLGYDGDLWPDRKTVYGVAEYVDTTAKNNLIGTSTDTTIDTHYGLKHILIGNTADTTINTHWGVKNSLIGTDSDTKDSNTIKGAKKYANGVKTDLIGTSTDTTINTHYGLKHILIGKSTDASTADTIWGAKNYAVKKLVGSTDDGATYETIYGARKYTDEAKENLIGKSTDQSSADTIWGAKNYAKNQISVKKYNQLTAQVIDQSGEGILEFLTVSSYLG